MLVTEKLFLFLPSTHGHTALVLLLLVVIFLVAHSEALFHQLPLALEVNAVVHGGAVARRRGVPEDLAHVVKEPGDREHD